MKSQSFDHRLQRHVKSFAFRHACIASSRSASSQSERRSRSRRPRARDRIPSIVNCEAQDASSIRTEPARGVRTTRAAARPLALAERSPLRSSFQTVAALTGAMSGTKSSPSPSRPPCSFSEETPRGLPHKPPVDSPLSPPYIFPYDSPSGPRCTGSRSSLPPTPLVCL
eukprot:6207466-Pleurochrysis_carterae.AAC.2